MKPHDINQVAVWLPMKNDKLDIKAYPAGYPYMSNGIIARSSINEPVTRYAKNYTKHQKTFSLCIITTENNAPELERWLDNVADNLEPRVIKQGFNKLEIFYEPKNS